MLTTDPGLNFIKPETYLSFNAARGNDWILGQLLIQNLVVRTLVSLDSGIACFQWLHCNSKINQTIMMDSLAFLFMFVLRTHPFTCTHVSFLKVFFDLEVN